MSRNQCTSIILCLKVTKELHTRPYRVTKRRCVWTKTLPLGHFMLHFIMFLYQMTTKASNSNSHLNLKNTSDSLFE